MKTKGVIAIVLALVLTMCLCTTSFANSSDEETPGTDFRYQLIKRITPAITISGGAADVTVSIKPATGVTFSYATMTVELIKSSSGATIQSWSGTYYPDGSGNIEFDDSQTLYATGAYYVRASGTVYATSGSHETFNVTSGTATY